MFEMDVLQYFCRIFLNIILSLSKLMLKQDNKLK